MLITDTQGAPGLRAFDAEEQEVLNEIIARQCVYRGAGLSEPQYAIAVEKRLNKDFGAAHSLLLNSGTSALLTALDYLRLEPGDEVVLPAYGWLSVLTTILYCRATPVICPVNDDLTMDSAALADLVGKRTRAVILVHPCGNVSDRDAVLSTTAGTDIAVIEDACQCLYGVPYSPDTLCTLLSFQSFKLITAGEGGALLTNSNAFYEHAVRFHDAGLDRFSHLPEKDELPRGIGLNLRMTELQAGILDRQMAKAKTILHSLELARDRYLQGLADVLQGAESYTVTNNHSNGNSCCILISADNAEAATALNNALNLAGVGSKIVGAMPYHSAPGWMRYLDANDYPYSTATVPTAYDNLQRLLLIEINWQQGDAFFSQLSNLQFNPGAS
jgi:dTDP-4-amino-4,6-dideoxygalactose transaminase